MLNREQDARERGSPEARLHQRGTASGCLYGELLFLRWLGYVGQFLRRYMPSRLTQRGGSCHKLVKDRVPADAPPLMARAAGSATPKPPNVALGSLRHFEVERASNGAAVLRIYQPNQAAQYVPKSDTRRHVRSRDVFGGLCEQVVACQDVAYEERLEHLDRALVARSDLTCTSFRHRWGRIRGQGRDRTSAVRIERVRIRRYRSLRDLSLEVEDYTALVGPNGAGKSSVLYALDWFFNGGKLADDDFHSGPSVDPDDETQEIDVEVTFGELTHADRATLGRYGRGDRASFRRTWSRTDGAQKMIGNSRQGPGFAEIRSATPVTEMRKLYQEARATHTTLPDVLRKDDIEAALTAWEDAPENAALLEDVDASDATHLFGFDGENTLSQRFRLVLVPASSNISEHVSPTGKSSAVARLVGALMLEAATAARQKWEEEHRDELRQLTEAIETSVEQSTVEQAQRVSGLLRAFVPGSSIEFVPEVPSWTVRGDPSIHTDVIIDGARRDVSRQGHGVQRAVIIAVLQALVPNGGEQEPGSDDGEVEATAEKLDPPALLICIEEPEVYQHPVRARHFARVLHRWSQRTNAQVLFATHSPYFVLPEQFDALRRLTLAHGETVQRSTTVAAVASAAGVDPDRVRRVVEKEVPRTFSEGFFADAVVFVEGDTDRVALEALAERLGKALDAAGTAVLAMGGKEGIKVPWHLLDLLGIPAYVVADADAEGAARKYPSDEEKRAAAAASHRNATAGLVEWLPGAGTTRVGSAPYAWGDPTTITDRWAILHDDLEAELEQWATYDAALAEGGAELRSKNVAVVRAAVLDADLQDLPENLLSLIDAISEFGGHQ